MIESVLSRMTTKKAHLASLIGVLTGMFVLTAVLAYTARETHRAAVERAEAQLADFTRLAQSEWTVRVRAGLRTAITETFPTPVSTLLREPAEHRPALAVISSRLSDEPDCLCVERSRMRRLFFVDFRTGQVDVLGGSVDTGYADALLARIARQPPIRIHEYLSIGLFTSEAGADALITGYVIQLDADQQRYAAIGFETGTGEIAAVLESAFRYGPLLDPQIMRDLRNDDVLAVSVSDPAGRLIYESTPDVNSPYTARGTLDDLLPGATVTAAILPATAPGLIAGGMPASPLPLVFGLLLLNGTLVFVAVLLLRREDEVVRLRSDFIAGVSHELRTPLAQIRMFAETLMLGRVRSDAERDRSLEIIDQEARRLTMLVENVLLYARAERRHVRIDPAPADLAGDIREAVQGFALLHRSRAIEVRTELQEKVIAPVDAGALKQMLLNLLDNAVKYGPPGQRITIGMALFGSHVRVWVDDQGPGIPKADRERVFDPFYRLRRDQESAVAGSGIGLAIVRELAGLHAGTVSIDEAPGGGTRVVIELPGAYLRPPSPSDALALT
ncbi:MAG: HAMP domain-containing histidine kinase [Gemmatimonadetes bacterium]|nr:HAMP domain-containing histidine kinase [Gemmatimonadota bacterium]